MHFYRDSDSNGNEVDLLLEYGAGLYALEIKAGATVNESRISPRARRLSNSATEYSSMAPIPSLSCGSPTLNLHAI